MPLKKTLKFSCIHNSSRFKYRIQLSIFCGMWSLFFSSVLHRRLFIHFLWCEQFWCAIPFTSLYRVHAGMARPLLTKKCTTACLEDTTTLKKNKQNKTEKGDRKEVVSHFSVLGNQDLERKYCLILDVFRSTD